MIREIQSFIQYLEGETSASNNTVVSYARDLKKMYEYLSAQNITEVKDVTEGTLNSFLMTLQDEGKKAATISRNIASMKAFFHYEVMNGTIINSPAGELKAPKVEKKPPVILSSEEIMLLLEQPKGTSPKEMRDKAMLELLYETGIRVSELISLQLEDLNLKESSIRCRDLHKERKISFDDVAKDALEKYLLFGRPGLVSDDKTPWLFTNCSGQVMSRQGFWKIIKFYGKKAGIQSEITPHTLRHSFAAHLVYNGVNLKTVQEIMGHADISSTQVYAQMGHER